MFAMSIFTGMARLGQHGKNIFSEEISVKSNVSSDDSSSDDESAISKSRLPEQRIDWAKARTALGLESPTVKTRARTRQASRSEDHGSLFRGSHDLFVIDKGKEGGGTANGMQQDYMGPLHGGIGASSRNVAASGLQHGIDLTDLYVNFDPFLRDKTSSQLSKDPKTRNIDLKSKEFGEMLSKLPGAAIEKLEKAPSFASESRRAPKRERRVEREKSKGSKWFDLPATELTDERKKDLELLQLRNAIDPKRHYKSNDRSVLPKYFQIGTIVEHAADFYHSRVPKKERKQTLVEELLADADLRRYNKQKYAEIMAEKARTKTGAFTKRRGKFKSKRARKH